jgi:hypothetical protein
MARKTAKAGSKKAKTVLPKKARHRPKRKINLNERAVIHQGIYPEFPI